MINDDDGLKMIKLYIIKNTTEFKVVKNNLPLQNSDISEIAFCSY